MIRFVASAVKVKCRVNVRPTTFRTLNFAAAFDRSKCSIAIPSYLFKSAGCFEQQHRNYTENYEDIFGVDLLDRPRAPKEKKKKKKKKNPKKEIPPMDPIDVALQKMKMRFEEIEKEHLGAKRGIRTVKWLAGKKCEGLHKTVTTKMANTILNSWVYCRHALQHGHYQLNDMTKVELAESILGKGTKVQVPDREARVILKELFRFGKSSQLERFMELDREKRKMMGRQEANTKRNLEGVPKIRNLATREEMLSHGYTDEDISDEMHKRAKHEFNRLMKMKGREMPAYLRNEVSGSRRRDAERVIRIQRRKEKRALRKKLEREARLKALGLPVDGHDDRTSSDNDDSETDDGYSSKGDSEDDGDANSNDDDSLSDVGDSDDSDSDDFEEVSDDDDDAEKSDVENDSSDKSIGSADRSEKVHQTAMKGYEVLDSKNIDHGDHFNTISIESEHNVDEISVDESNVGVDLDDDKNRR
jgi:hypothetical protein